jgi:hypothetical protein
MKLETFYAYANEAPCISLNRKTQQTTMSRTGENIKGKSPEKSAVRHSNQRNQQLLPYLPAFSGQLSHSDEDTQ